MGVAAIVVTDGGVVEVPVSLGEPVVEVPVSLGEPVVEVLVDDGWPDLPFVPPAPPDLPFVGGILAGLVLPGVVMVVVDEVFDAPVPPWGVVAVVVVVAEDAPVPSGVSVAADFVEPASARPWPRLPAAGELVPVDAAVVGVCLEVLDDRCA